jgi:hypothetical protein
MYSWETLGGSVGTYSMSRPLSLAMALSAVVRGFPYKSDALPQDKRSWDGGWRYITGIDLAKRHGGDGGLQ